jgi:molecular chaperone DnaJ
VSTKDYLEKDFYKVLGVSKDADAAAIKKAYRKLARTHHPDANKGDSASEDRFKEISEAYDVLSDDKTRREYDEARALFGAGGLRFGGGGAPGGFGGPGGGGVSFDMGDIFGSGSGTGGGLGDVLGGLFGRGRGSAGQAVRRGADVESEVTLSFSEAVDGVTVPLRLTGEGACATCHGTGAKAGTTPRVCPTCQGTGQTSRNAGGFAFAEPCRDCRGRGLVVDDPCPVCHGSGRAHSTRTVNARIPAGVRDGQRIRLKGKGAPGERGGPAGDLYIVVHVAAHPLFGRRDDHLTLTLPATYPELALGAQISVPTLGGAPVTLKIPAGTADGRTFRVKGKGAARRDGTRGDLLVTVQVAVPQKLDAKARELLEAYREATTGDDPRAGLLEAARNPSHDGRAGAG